MDQVVVIVGPTGAGKTELALKLAKKYHGEIIGADSRQVYKKLNIGTAKPRGEWRGGVYLVDRIPYHLVDIIEPDEPFTLADYKKLALVKIREVISRGRRPILVGGTGLYISTIVHNWQLPALAADKIVRQELEKKSTKELLEMLGKLDRPAWQAIDKKNRRRLVRALEVCLLSGQPFSVQRRKSQPLFEFLQIGLAVPRQNLDQTLDKRVEEMIKAGLVKEVRELLAAGYPEDLPALASIGYREIIDYLKGRVALAEAIRLIKQHTHLYARRQLTWFRKDQTIRWVKGGPGADSLVANFSF